MWIRFSGLLGLVIFLFGFIASFLVQQFNQPLLMAHMALGLLLIAVWFFGYGLKNINQAGDVLKGRSSRFGANALLYSIVFIGFLAVINYLAHQHNLRWDLTESRVYSLSQQSETALKNINKPLKIVAFKGISQIDEFALKDLLDLYKYSNSKIAVEMIDARSKPHLLDRYEMKPGNQVYLEYGEGEKKGVSHINEVSEEAITNAVIKLARGEAKRVYYVEGHGEPDITSDAPQGLKSFAEAVGDEHLLIENIILAQKPVVPENAAAVVLISPKKPLLPEEKNTLIQYVEGGGRLLLFADPRAANDVRDLAAHFNIDIGNNVVIDQIQRMFAAPALGAQPIVRDYAQHPITKNLKARDITVFNIASSVKAGGQKKAGAVYSELAKTGPQAWGETDFQ